MLRNENASNRRGIGLHFKVWIEAPAMFYGMAPHGLMRMNYGRSLPGFLKSLIRKCEGCAEVLKNQLRLEVCAAMQVSNHCR